MKRSFVVESTSRARPETVFAILADGSRWQDWAGPFVPRSSWAADSPPGGLRSVRRLGVGPLSSREEIVAFDPPRRLEYVLRSAERWHHYRAEVVVRALPEGGSHIRWSGSLDARVPGSAAFLCAGFRALVAGFARRLARYAESVPTAE